MLHLWCLNLCHSPAKAPAAPRAHVSPPFPPRHRWERNTNARGPWSAAPLLLLPPQYPFSHIYTTLCLPPSIPVCSLPRTAKDILPSEIRTISADTTWQRPLSRLWRPPCHIQDLNVYVWLTVAELVMCWQESHPYLSFSISYRAEARNVWGIHCLKPVVLVRLQIWYKRPRLKSRGLRHSKLDFFSKICREQCDCLI